MQNCFVRTCARVGRMAVLVAVGSTLWAQSPGTGAVSGTVVDPSGAVVAKAKITVINEETHAARSAETSGDGAFRVSLLPPGDYEISVNAPGFANRRMKDVHIGA